jgi:hypothetical protein
MQTKHAIAIIKGQIRQLQQPRSTNNITVEKNKKGQAIACPFYLRISSQRKDNYT